MPLAVWAGRGWPSHDVGLRSGSNDEVRIATQDGTAMVADNDYAAKSLAGVTIPAGSSTYTFSVLVNGDAQVGPVEAEVRRVLSGAR